MTRVTCGYWPGRWSQLARVQRRRALRCCSALEEVQGTEAGARSLSVSRELMAYVIAAELVGLDGAQRDKFETWLRAVCSAGFSGSHPAQHPRGSGPTIGVRTPGASRLAVAIYLDDREEIERAAWVFRGWTGDVRRVGTTSSSASAGGSLKTVSRDYGINPAGARISSHPVGGVLPDDQRRGGPFPLAATPGELRIRGTAGCGGASCDAGSLGYAGLGVG